MLFCSLTDVAAIWNANAFFAYVITVKMFKLPWEGKRVFAVLLATAGVMAVIYGGASTQGDNNGQPEVTRAVPTATAPLLGDLLTLIASVGYGFFQVFYKRYLALPSDPEHGELPQSSYAPIPRSSFDDIRDTDPFTEDFTSDNSQSISDTTVYPPPFALHPNLLTSSAGIITLLFLWIPLPVLHYTGTEPFRWPPNWYVALVVSGIALSGVAFNAGFMVIPWFSVCTTKA
jgi:drug/metabolite transporter (DMT)-like permease